MNDAVLNIANDPKSYHPVATNHFTVTFHMPEGLINQSDPEKRAFAKEDLILTLKIANDTIEEPRFTQQTLSYKKGNLSIEFPGSIDAFSGTARFHVFVSKSAYDVLYSWKMASGNHLTGEIGDPDSYWADVDIDVTTGNKGTLVGTWNWHNVWCNSLSGASFDNSASTPKTCEIGLKYIRPEWTSSQYTG